MTESISKPNKHTWKNRKSSNHRKREFDNFSSIDIEKDATKEYFRKVQNKSCGVLIGIVLIFLICNFPRFLVKTFIITSQGKGLYEHFLYCNDLQLLHVPAFVHVMGKFDRLYKEFI